MSLTPGARLGPYEIVSLLGAGGMGEVYRARDTRLGRDVAVKVLTAAFASDPDRMRRFEQEARAVAALNHPNVLSVFDTGTHDGVPYLVTELLEGQSFRELLAEGPIAARKVAEYARQIAAGLAAAHEKHIVHRDLKPEKLRVSPGLERVLRHCLEKKPADRFQSARDLTFALGALSDASGPAPAPAIPRTQTPWYFAAVVAGVLLLAALAYWAGRRGTVL